MAAITDRSRRLRGMGIAFLILGLALLGVGAVTRQIAFLPMGTAMVGAGIAFGAAARSSRPHP